MINIDKQKVIQIDLETILNSDDVERMLERGPLTTIYPKPNKQEKVIDRLLFASISI
jgi:hypothetical protein